MNKEVLSLLDDLKINYKIVEHPVVTTVKDADSYIEGFPGARTKTLFLRNKNKKRFILLVLDGAKRLNTKKISKILGESRISFASPENMLEKIGADPGNVSIFSLINNKEKDVELFFDKELMDNNIIFTFHPNINNKTLFIEKNDMFKFLNSIKFNPNIIDL